MRTHASAAVGFIDEVAGELSLERALAVYLRLLDVPPGERRAVAVRTLALLERTTAPEALAAEAEDDQDDFVERLARRIRGRRRNRLRARIDTAAARARKAVRGAHLDGAAAVATALEGVLEPVEGVQAYLEALDLDPAWAARIFHDTVATVPPPRRRRRRRRPDPT